MGLRVEAPNFGDSPENLAPASRISRSLKVIGTDTNRPAACDFSLTFHSNHSINQSSWLSRTVSETYTVSSGTLKAVLNVFFSLHHSNCLYLMNTKWYLL